MILPIPIPYWTSVREALYQALDKVNNEQLAFSPAAGLWPLGSVALHIASAENGWFRHIITGELKDWPTDFQLEDHPTVLDIKALLVQVHARTDAYLEAILPEEMERIIVSPWGARFPVRYAIWHILEHEIHHRGEIFIMLGMLGMEAPDV